MKNTQTELLDALRAEHGSDAASARALGITRQAVSLLRRNNIADDATITAACALLGRPAGLHLARHRADHASDPATAAAWADAAAQLARLAEANTAPKPSPQSAKPPDNAAKGTCHNADGNTNYANYRNDGRGPSQVAP